MPLAGIILSTMNAAQPVQLNPPKIVAHLRQMDQSPNIIQLKFDVPNAPSPYKCKYRVDREDDLGNLDLEPVKISPVYHIHEKDVIYQFKGYPMTNYKVSVIAWDNQSDPPAWSTRKWEKWICYGEDGYYLPDGHVQKLQEKAVEFVHVYQFRMEPILGFFRCKDQAYWKKCHERGGIMESHIRRDMDGNKTRLNHSHGGVFFFARSHPLSFNYFGEKLRIFPTQSIFAGLNPATDFAFYFSDFKCYRNSGSAHYLTICCCRRGSAEHDYCARKMGQFELDITANQFLQWRQAGDGTGGQFFVPGRRATWIELFFMDNVEYDVEKVVHFKVPREEEEDFKAMWDCKALRECRELLAQGKIVQMNNKQRKNNKNSVYDKKRHDCSRCRISPDLA